MTQLSSRVVRTHLAIFSLAAPISAIVTYTALTWFVGVFDGTHGGWTGKALLFSVIIEFLTNDIGNANVLVNREEHSFTSQRSCRPFQHMRIREKEQQRMMPSFHPGLVSRRSRVA